MKNYDGWVIRSNFNIPNFLIYNTFRTTRAEYIAYYCRDLGRDWYDRYRRSGKLECVKANLSQVHDY